MRLRRYASGLLPFAALALSGAVPSPAAPAAAAPPGVQVVKGATIADKIERAAPSPGGRGGVIAEDEGWRVHATERDAPGLAEQHEGDTDVWYVLAGGGTLVTGGTIVDASITGPGEQRGPAIRGGTELAIAAGDLISIRPGVPHWIKAVDGRIRYLTVKVHGRPAPAGRAR
jgi:mannose-6-phosphate isomerase-like protein (cupin superfamily)